MIPTWAAMHPNGEAWWRFHNRHPEVFAGLERLADQWAARRGPDSRCSIKMLWETLRYNTALGDPDARFRLNNSHTSLYARLLVERHPEFGAMFETRTSPGAQRALGSVA